MIRLVLIYKTETDISRQCALDSYMKLVVEYAYTHWEPSVVMKLILDSNVHGVNMGPSWVLSAPAGPHVGHMDLVIRDYITIGGTGRCPNVRQSWLPPVSRKKLV